MTLGDLAVDHYSPVPLYHQIAEEIRSGVATGKLPAGHSIGSEKQLADKLGVSLPTVRRAVHILAAEGVVVRKRGVGTFLCDPAPPNLFRAVSLDPNLEGSKCRLAKLERVTPESGIQERMAPDDESGVWRLVRINTHGGKPTAVLENFLAQEPSAPSRERFAGSEADVTLLSPIRNGRSVHYEIKVLEADGWLAHELRVPPGTPLIRLEQTVYDSDGQPVEFATHSYLASHHRLEATMSPSRSCGQD